MREKCEMITKKAFAKIISTAVFEAESGLDVRPKPENNPLLLVLFISIKSSNFLKESKIFSNHSETAITRTSTQHNPTYVWLYGPYNSFNINTMRPNQLNRYYTSRKTFLREPKISIHPPSSLLLPMIAFLRKRTSEQGKLPLKSKTILALEPVHPPSLNSLHSSYHPTLCWPIGRKTTSS